jgi:CheY-like chemotaxis protein
MIILAVEDDLEDFEFFCEAIKEIDASIVIIKASNGHEALDVLDNQTLKPDYIFLDINMPLMDGRVCLEKIKKDDRFRDIPVIMYSTSNNKTEISQFKMMGANFLVKPDRFTHLVKSLNFILGYSAERSDFFFIFL